MADDSEFINEIYEFHPSDTPRGMLYYKLQELTVEQQHRLNVHKINIIRNNQKYLHEHPEVKIITSTMLRAVMKARPKYYVHKFLLNYLIDSWADIKKEVKIAIAERTHKESIERQRVATIEYLKELYEEEGFEEAEEYSESRFDEMLNSKARHSVKNICKSVVSGIVDKLEMKEKHRVHIQISENENESADSDVQLEFNEIEEEDDVSLEFDDYE